MEIKILNQVTYEANTIDGAENTASVYAPKAQHICYMVVASASSSPVGTTIQVQASLDGTNFVALDSAVSVTGNGVFHAKVAPSSAAFLYYRLAYARSSGSYVATTTLVTKGEEV